MAGLQLERALTALQPNVAQRLERLGQVVPARATQAALPFAEYVQQARAYAQHDPLFRRQFEDAMRQYEQIQQAQGGLT